MKTRLVIDAGQRLGASFPAAADAAELVQLVNNVSCSSPISNLFPRRNRLYMFLNNFGRAQAQEQLHIGWSQFNNERGSRAVRIL